MLSGYILPQILILPHIKLVRYDKSEVQIGLSMVTIKLFSLKAFIFTFLFCIILNHGFMGTVSWGALCAHHHIVPKLVIVKNQFFLSNGMTFFIPIFLPLGFYT